jgi:hypothetical protein
MKKITMLSCLTVATLYSWSGKESATDKNVNFYGTIETHEGQRWHVQNIGIGRERSEAKYKNIVMYDKPHEETTEVDGKRLLPTNPGRMSYSEIAFNEIKSIDIPTNAPIWVYKKDSERYGIEYVEATVIHKDNTKASYLIELGREDMTKKTKVFCSIRHTKNPETAPVIPATESGSQDELFCKGIKMDELEEKGVPLQAIKKLSIEGFCHQVVVN